MLDQYKNDIKNDFMDLTNADISVYFLNCKDKNLDSCDIINSSNINIYNYESSRCKNNSKITYENGEVTVEAENKDVCYVYFTTQLKQIILVKENISDEGKEVNSIPNNNYSLESINCENGVTGEFDENTRTFNYLGDNFNTTCKAVFVKKPDNSGGN
jgi:hypothetical protein